MNAGPPLRPITWPNGKKFAFTVFDDTDLTTMVNGPPVYDLLTDLDFRITKSVWPVAPTGPPTVGGTTCDDPAYRRWVQDLQEAGHEIGLHNASDHSSTRAETIAALDRFNDLFGHDPKVGADHSYNHEALYCGERRLSGWRSYAYQGLMAMSRPDATPYAGEIPTSPYFWGDVCRERITYWRSLTFCDLDLFRPSPVLPYHDPRRHYVNWWFTSTHVPGIDHFLDLLDPARLDELEERGGVCILYTHFGVGYAPDGRLDPRFAEVMARLRERDGWFAPVSEVLDHLRTAGRAQVIDNRQRASMERRWVADQVRGAGVGELRRLGRRIQRTVRSQ